MDEHPDLEKEIVRARLELARARAETAMQDQRLFRLRRSLSWRLTVPVRKIRPAVLKQRDRLRNGQQAILHWGRQIGEQLTARLQHRTDTSPSALDAPLPHAATRRGYAGWLSRFDTPQAADMDIFHHLVETYRNYFAPICVIYQFNARTLSNAPAIADSLMAQYFTEWRAVFTFDSSCQHDEVAAICQAVTAPRLTTAAPYPPLKEGEALVLASGNVCLRPHALVVLSCAARRDIRLVYGDEDMRSRDGVRHTPFFKPDFSPELLRHVDYLTGGSMLAGDAALNQRVYASLLAGENLQQVLQRAVRGLRRAQTCHVPFILSHLLGKMPQRHRIAPDIVLPAGHEWPTISIIIPTRDRLDLLRACIDSIGAKTDYPADRIQIIIVDNGSTEKAVLEYLSAIQKDTRVVVIRDDGPFNFPRLNNLAAKYASHEILLFLNNDTEVERRDWLKQLASYAVQKDVAAVGCKLLYGDRTVQHAGCVIGMCGGAGHAGVGIASDADGYFGLMNATREVSAVTGACLAIRAALFAELGGFDTGFAVAFNDTLLCLAAQARGYRNLTIGTPLLLHHESRSRGYDDTPDKQALFRHEMARARNRYPDVFDNDPYYNPNLDLYQLYDLSFPPRRRKFWRDIPEISCARNILVLAPPRQHGETVGLFVEKQAYALQEQGFQVTVGCDDVQSNKEKTALRYVNLNTCQDAATYSVEHDIDCVISPVGKYYTISQLIGEACKIIFYDMGDDRLHYFSPLGHPFGHLDMPASCDGMADSLVNFVNIIKHNQPLPYHIQQPVTDPVSY